MQMNNKKRRRLPVHIAEAMTAILDYLWQKEAQDYLSCNRDDQETHIFSQLLTVRQWLVQQFQCSKKPLRESETKA